MLEPTDAGADQTFQVTTSGATNLLQETNSGEEDLLQSNEPRTTLVETSSSQQPLPSTTQQVDIEMISPITAPKAKSPQRHLPAENGGSRVEIRSK